MEVPAWVIDAVVALFAAGLLATVGFVGQTLAKLKKQSAQLVALLQWMKEQDESHDEKLTALLPLLEKAVRLTRATRDTMLWLADQATPQGVSPPPPVEPG